ncbi:MAG: hypothetical protein OEV89_05255 [Desulfobulbaceae bacterium]|nr:hypothetical protein [Desulfobulbaceae bacterium]HIJ90157.1 hypothetical protein [Deltaproteobacteria bacterium]
MAVGLILIWVAVDILGLAKCSVPSGLMEKLKVKGAWGAEILIAGLGVYFLLRPFL